MSKLDITAAIWIDPARRGGRPCLNGTQLYLEHPAENLAAGVTLDEYRNDYALEHLTDRDILAAVAWWVLNDRSRLKRHSEIRKAWNDWAFDTWDHCWNLDHEPTSPPELETT